VIAAKNNIEATASAFAEALSDSATGSAAAEAIA